MRRIFPKQDESFFLQETVFEGWERFFAFAQNDIPRRPLVKTGRLPYNKQANQYHAYGEYNMKTIEIFTDGACSGNPGPGGWGAVLRFGETVKELSGGERATTNNRMELTAVIESLAALKEPCKVALTSDSRYVVDAIEKGWLRNWQRKGWKKADGSAVLNVDLWQRLLPLLTTHDVRFHWIRGHAGHAENERCDQLAVAARSSL
jgi:ribonuclease HI